VTAMTSRHRAAGREALARLPLLDLDELRQEWRRLHRAEACPRLSRDLLVRAVAYRLQELAFGGLRPEPQRQLRQVAMELKQTGAARTRLRPQLASGTRLIREWRGRHYEVVVLDDGFSWQGTRYRSLSAVARTITGTAWSGPLFFRLKWHVDGRSGALGLLRKRAPAGHQPGRSRDRAQYLRPLPREGDLRHRLLAYQKYYNEVRTNLSLQKDAPVRREVRKTGRVLPIPVLGGLHHQYVRV
jgi:hypothetical protein